MEDKRGFIFPGQGAQYVGMGKDFYDSFSVAKAVVEEASDQLSIGFKKLLFDGPAELLSETRYSQPAIFVTSAMILQTVRKEFPNLVPSLCAGLSLGEYTALYAADVISFATALQLVAARGAFMQEACLESQGTMRVILGLEPEAIQPHLPNNVWIANFNCPGQVVIAGLTSQMPLAEQLLTAQGVKRIVSLDVSGAFHTPLMQSAQQKLGPKLKEASIQLSSIPVIMNVSAEIAHSVEEIRTNLMNQVVSPTKWEQTVRKMEGLGVDLYIEIGPGKTLAGMNRKIVQTPTITVTEVSNLGKLRC